MGPLPYNNIESLVTMIKYKVWKSWTSEDIEFGKARLWRSENIKFGKVRLWKSESIKFGRDQNRQLERPLSATVH